MLVDAFLSGKSEIACELFAHFIDEFKRIGNVSVHPAKTMIGIATPRRRVAYVTHFGKNFIRVVFPFEVPYSNNMCFAKIAQVPGDERQFNHHLKIMGKDDVNAEVKSFMKLALDGGQVKR